MNELPYVIAINAICMAGLGFFVVMWIKGVNANFKDLSSSIKDIYEELDERVSDSRCGERRGDLRRDIERIEKR